jgi:hypothetical protein
VQLLCTPLAYEACENKYLSKLDGGSLSQEELLSYVQVLERAKGGVGADAR